MLKKVGIRLEKPNVFIILLIICSLFAVFLYKKAAITEINGNYITNEKFIKSHLGPNAEKLADFKEFQFLIDNNNVCSSDVYMLILVGSHPSHVKLRQVLRSTIGNPGIEDKVFKIVFAFGYLTNTTDQQQIIKENEEYGDIIQGNFIDSYKNVTLRDLMALRWTWQRCFQAKYVLRMDDDTAIDIYSLVNNLDSCCSARSVFIGCCVIWKRAKVARSGRYAVSVNEHPAPYYSDYCTGWMYVVTPRMAYLLDEASSNVRCYWMNDCYITGDLVEWIGLRHTQVHLSYSDNEKYMRDMLKKNSKTFYNVGPTKGDSSLTFELFNLYKRKALN